MEQWKDIVGFEGLYQVSDLGRVRSLDRAVAGARGSKRLIRGRILVLKHNSSTSDHLFVLLSSGNKKFKRYVHRLVLSTFLEVCPPEKECCHNDGDPTNNCLSNLRWDSHSNNILDCRYHSVGKGRPVERSDGVVFHNKTHASENTPGAYQSNISKCCLGQRNQSGGYRWKYV